MTRKTRNGLIFIVAAIAFSAAATASPLFGQSKPGELPNGLVQHGREQRPEHDDHGMSAKEAARQAQSINDGGRVLSVDEANGGWRVKLLKDGNVRFVFVPN